MAAETIPTTIAHRSSSSFVVPPMPTLIPSGSSFASLSCSGEFCFWTRWWLSIGSISQNQNQFQPVKLLCVLIILLLTHCDCSCAMILIFLVDVLILRFLFIFHLISMFLFSTNFDFKEHEEGVLQGFWTDLLLFFRMKPQRFQRISRSRARGFFPIYPCL